LLVWSRFGAYTVSGLPPGSYRVAFAASGHVSQFYNAQPSLAGADPVTVTAGSSTAGIDAALAEPPPTLTHLGETHRTFRGGNKLATLARKQAPVGTSFRFTVNSASSVELSFTRSVKGREVGQNCVAKTGSNAGKHSCVRTVLVGRLSYAVAAGVHSLYFDGRVSRSRTPRPGRYELVIVASDAAGHSQSRSISFTIVK
jgi:hypothetical protein